jgi:hypothetical protein
MGGSCKCLLIVPFQKKVKLRVLLSSKVRLKCYIYCTSWVKVARSWTAFFNFVTFPGKLQETLRHCSTLMYQIDFWNCAIHYTVSGFTEFHKIPVFTELPGL